MSEPTKKKATAPKRSAADAVEMARQVTKRLSRMGMAEDASRPDDISSAHWNRLKQRLTDQVVGEVAGEWKAKRQGQIVPNFKPLTPDQVAEPVDLPVWRVRGLWSLGSHGTWAGPKKSLKTTLHDGMAVGVASGQKVLGEWEVVEPGPVLIYAGEGSVEWRKKSLQRIAHDLYNVKIGTGDDEAHVFVVDAAYPFNTPEFRLALRKNIRDIHPAFVTLDSTYNYHPRGINTADMYDRGPLFAELSALVRDSDPDTSLMLIDHMRQAASLDLDSIAMAGVGQWVDSWILNLPEDANPEEGNFKVNMEIGSRRWGGRRRDAAVDLGHFDEDDEQWSHAMTVTISQGEWGSKKSGRGDGTLDADILQRVTDEPWAYTLSALEDKIGGNRDRFRARVANLTSQRLIVVESRAAKEGKRMVTRERVGIPDDVHVQLATPPPPRTERGRGRGGATTPPKKGRS